MNVKRYYHVYTKGLEDDVIFRNREDFVVGMNYVPVSLKIAGVHVIVFVLMSNHFHFLVYGDKLSALKFIDSYKRLISRYVRNVYGVAKLLRNVDTGCSEVDMNDEALKRLIAYILNNPVKAGVNCFPQNYEWGSGKCYFSNFDYNRNSHSLSELGVREQSRILRSDVRLDGKYKINSEGYIEPESYIRKDIVEKIFRSAKSFEYFLSTSSRDQRRDPSEESRQVVFSDTLVLSGVNEILEKRYESLDVSELSELNRTKLILELRKVFNAPPKQLARVLGLTLREVVNSLNWQ